MEGVVVLCPPLQMEESTQPVRGSLPYHQERGRGDESTNTNNNNNNTNKKVNNNKWFSETLTLVILN